MADDIITRDANGDLAVNTVVSTEANVPYNYDECFTIDTNGRRALRVVGSGGGAHNLGYFATLGALQTAHPTAEAGDYALVGETDTFWVWDSDGSEWLDTTRRGQVSSVNGKTGDVVIPAIVAIPGTSVVQQLETETIYNCGELTELSITFSASPTVSYISQLNFSSGVTPTSITAPNTVVWLGNDITGGVFVPVASKRYCVLFFYDGTAVRGLVQGA